MTNTYNNVVGGSGSGAGDAVIYYRKPITGQHAGWITWADSLSGTKLQDYSMRGFEPLWKYGKINSAERDTRRFGDKSHPADPTMTPAKYTWEAILSHPDGPAEFPVDQVVTYRWYRPENCPVPDVDFPQLKGHRIRELNCPEQCNRLPFVELDGVGGIAALRQHLRIMHGWDQANLIAWGERVGVDFTKADVGLLAINEVEVDAGPALRCDECGEEFSGGMAKARLTKHQKTHTKVPVEVV